MSHRLPAGLLASLLTLWGGCDRVFPYSPALAVVDARWDGARDSSVDRPRDGSGTPDRSDGPRPDRAGDSPKLLDKRPSLEKPKLADKATADKATADKPKVPDKAVSVEKPKAPESTVSPPDVTFFTDSCICPFVTCCTCQCFPKNTKCLDIICGS